MNKIAVGTKSGDILEFQITDDIQIINPNTFNLPIGKVNFQDHDPPISISLDNTSSFFYSITSKGLLSVWNIKTFTSIYSYDFKVNAKYIYHFKYQNFIDSNKLFIYLAIGVLSWVFPLVCSTVSVIQMIQIDAHGFCWVKEDSISSYLVYVVIFLCYIINVIMLLLLRKEIKEFLKQENAFILYHKFFKRITIFSI